MKNPDMKNMKIKGVLFDKDGTLLDFNETWLEAYIKSARFLADDVGRPELADELLASGGYIVETGGWVRDSLLASGTNAQILEFWGEQIGGFKQSQITAIKEIFSVAANNHTSVLDDMPEFMRALKSHGMTLGLATMDDERHAHSALQGLGVHGMFDFICGADSGFGIKPQPGMVDAFSQSCGIENKQVIMVGDSPKDLDMGRNAGVALNIGVLTGAHTKAELQPLSDYVYENISGLAALLDDLQAGEKS